MIEGQNQRNIPVSIIATVILLLPVEFLKLLLLPKSIVVLPLLFKTLGVEVVLLVVESVTQELSAAGLADNEIKSPGLAEDVEHFNPKGFVKDMELNKFPIERGSWLLHVKIDPSNRFEDTSPWVQSSAKVRSVIVPSERH